MTNNNSKLNARITNTISGYKEFWISQYTEKLPIYSLLTITICEDPITNNNTWRAFGRPINIWFDTTNIREFPNHLHRYKALKRLNAYTKKNFKIEKSGISLCIFLLKALHDILMHSVTESMIITCWNLTWYLIL